MGYTPSINTDTPSLHPLITTFASSISHMFALFIVCAHLPYTHIATSPPPPIPASIVDTPTPIVDTLHPLSPPPCVSCRVLMSKLQELAAASLSLGLPGDPLSQVRVCLVVVVVVCVLKR